MDRQAAREKSAFVAPTEVKEGLGPAGAFAGNSNWRVDMSRCAFFFFFCFSLGGNIVGFCPSVFVFFYDAC